MELSRSYLLKKRIIIMALLALTLLIVFFLGCLIGPYKLSFIECIKTFFGQGDKNSNLVIFQMRLPRLVLSILVGLGMGASGVIMQNIMRNDLASPGTLGVSDGASLFITLYVALIQAIFDFPLLLPILAMVGGLISALLIYLFSYKKNKVINPTRIILTGVSIGAMYQALSQFLMFMLDESKLEFIQRWNAGELWATEWRYIVILFFWTFIIGSIAIFKSYTLNVINLGYDSATGVGVNTKKEFIFFAILAVALSSGAVAFGGNFFFLGLIGPHVARKLVGYDARFLIPISGIVSSIFILLANILVEDITLFMNIPTGILISILSVPYFIYLLIRSK
jgi:ABC-type Fe3+-siderophore transport system permease subunit